jgi:hypothetical protein
LIITIPEPSGFSCLYRTKRRPRSGAAVVADQTTLLRHLPPLDIVKA